MHVKTYLEFTKSERRQIADKTFYPAEEWEETNGELIAAVDINDYVKDLAKTMQQSLIDGRFVSKATLEAYAAELMEDFEAITIKNASGKEEIYYFRPW